MNIKSEMRLNKITCQFEDRELEKEFLLARWEKTWSYIKVLLYFNVPLGFIIRIDDLFIFWSSIDVLGRIYIANEGINAQLSLPKKNLKNLIQKIKL